jgi:hypothetical protein
VSVFPQLFFAFMSGNFAQFSFSSAGHFYFSLVILLERPKLRRNIISMGQLEEKVK